MDFSPLRMFVGWAFFVASYFFLIRSWTSRFMEAVWKLAAINWLLFILFRTAAQNGWLGLRPGQPVLDRKLDLTEGLTALIGFPAIILAFISFFGFITAIKNRSTGHH